MNKKVVVAMSGGVDSSVVAALLKEKGYEVIGITMQIWPSENTSFEDEKFGGCCSLSSVEDARRVADKIDIPYYVLNFRDIFNKEVIQNFISEYKRARTPNPCIRCNQFIKFDALLNKARSLEADYIATGHYARIKHDDERNRYLLYRGVDKHKDQSYMLYVMTQEQLKRTLMPLGGYKKEKTRELAKKLGLKVADKPESQEICFIPDDDYRRFLKEEIGESVKEGEIHDSNGNVVGKHQGIVNYTVGQRKGLGISSEEPLYVLEIDSSKNLITVGPQESLKKNGLIGTEPNYIAFDNLKGEKEISIQTRYNMEPVKARMKMKDDRVEVEFKDPQTGITPGQAAVFYDEDEVLGGVTIEKAL